MEANNELIHNKGINVFMGGAFSSDRPIKSVRKVTFVQKIKI